jgi:hypothetical protein
MKFQNALFLPLFFLVAGLSAQSAPVLKPDSSAVKSNKTVAQIKNTDEELILDDNDKSILPVVKKSTVPAATAADTVKKQTGTPASAAAGAGAGAVHAIPSPAQNPVKDVKDVKDTVKKVTDEELILDGGEEDLLAKIRTIKPKTAVPEKARPDSGTIAPDLQNRTTAAGITDSAMQPRQSSVTETSGGATDAPSALSAPAVIQDARSINFARNLKEYRSPKLAMLMSLILPGSGQVYAKSNLWAMAFGVIEVALVSTGFTLSAKAKNLKKEARTYADQHYSAPGFQQYTNDLRQFLNTNSATFKNPDSVYREIFDNLSSDSVFLVNAGQKNDAYYDDIGREALPYVRGWNDVRPVFSSSDAFQSSITPADPEFENIPQAEFSFRFRLKSDTSIQRYGVSAYQSHYREMVNDSRQWAKYSNRTFLSLLVNHVASSILAGITAKRHNDELLGNESFWQHITIEQRFVNTGSETVPSYALQVGF